MISSVESGIESEESLIKTFWDANEALPAKIKEIIRIEIKRERFDTIF